MLLMIQHHFLQLLGMAAALSSTVALVVAQVMVAPPSDAERSIIDRTDVERGDRFHRENAEVMDRMMAGMPPASTGDIDHDFVAAMAPPMPTHVFALASNADGSGLIQPLAECITNPAGAAIVHAVGPIRQLVQQQTEAPRRLLVIKAGTIAQPDRRFKFISSEGPSNCPQNLHRRRVA